MKNIKVLIMEDRHAEATYLKDTLHELGYQVPAVATCLQEGLEYFHEHQPDISLVDIYLNGKPDGIVFGMNMQKEKGGRKPFLFLTGADDASTFRLAKTSGPCNYLLKPFNKPELQYAIELALEKHAPDASPVPPAASKPSSPPASSIFVKRGNHLVNIRYDDIRWVEVEGKYSKIVCNDQKFVVQQPLQDVHASLPGEQFLRVHRSYIINAREIAKIDTQTHEAFFRDGKTLFFSRRYLDDFLQVFKLIK